MSDFPIPPTCKRDAPEWCGTVTSETTVLNVIHIAINNHTAQMGDAVELNSVVETGHGPYAVHLHVCVQPLKRAPAN